MGVDKFSDSFRGKYSRAILEMNLEVADLAGGGGGEGGYGNVHISGAKMKY
jgi:hypothetical protein